MKYGLVAFILALFIGYGPRWSAYYVAGMMGEDKIKVLGSLSEYSIPCDSQATENSSCTNSYLVPSTIYKKWGDQAAIGFGQIISATRYRCIENKTRHTDVDDPSNPGRTFDIFTTYQTLAISTLGCKEGVIVEAWSRKTAVRKGYIGGTAVVGHYTAVDRVKRLTEFFTMHLLFGLSVAFLILMLMSERLYRYSDNKLALSIYEITLPIWFFNSLIISGIAQTIFAFVQTPVFFNKVSMFLTHLSLVLLPVLLLKKHYLTGKKIYAPLVLIVLLLAAAAYSQFFAKVFMPIELVILAIATIIVLTTREVEYLFLLTTALLTCLKIYNVDGLPAEYSIYPFYAFAVTFTILSKIRINSRLVALTQWSHSLEWRKSSETLLEVLVKKIHQEVGANRTTLLSVSQEGQVKIYSAVGNEKISCMIRTELPPIFAHVFSMGDPLIHLDSMGEKYRHIARGAHPKDVYQSKYFSILPVHSESRVVGAIAFTDYPKSWVKSMGQTFLMRHLTRTLESTLIEQIHAQDWKNRGTWSEKLLEIQKELPQVESLSEAHHIICRTLNCFGFLASLDSKSRLFSVHAIEGYPKEVGDRLQNGNIYAHRENEQGPIALAANQERSIIVSDVKLLRGVLHENSNFFFEKSGTQSCAAIPIFSPNTVNKIRSLWGVIFLERSIDDVFTLEAKNALEQISAEITELLNRLDHERTSTQTLKALTNFVPEHVVARVIQNHLEREEDRGLLLLIDLKGSTSLALKVGSDAWLNRARSLAKPLEAAARRHGLSWQYFQWDAFFFTLSSTEPKMEDLNRASDFLIEAHEIIRTLYIKHYSSYGDFSNEGNPVCRACITFGDISRGFQEGATRSWTIVGNEMSAISKFEDLCKRIDGVVFADESLRSVLRSNWIDTGMTVPSTGRKIFKNISFTQRKLGKKNVDEAA